MFATHVERKPVLFTKKEANEKQGKTLVSRSAVGILPAGALGCVTGMTQVGDGCLLTVQWQLPDSDFTETISKDQYDQILADIAD